MATTGSASCVLEVPSVSSPEVLSSDTRTAVPLSLKKNALWTALGNGVYAVAQWLQVAIIARLGTSVEVGHYALALATAAPVFMLFNLQLRQIQATDATRKNTFAEYLGLRFLSSTCAFVLVCVLGWFSSHSMHAAVLCLLLGLFKGVESVSDIYQGLLQQHERMDYVGRSLLIKSALIISSFGSVYFLTRNLICGVLAMVGAQLVGLLLYDVRASYLATHSSSAGQWRRVIRQMSRANLHLAALKPLAVRALPLGIAMMLISLYGNLPRFVLNKYTGPRGVGVFAAINYLSMIGGLTVTAIGTSLSPRLSQYAHTNRHAYRKLLNRFALFACGLAAAGVLASLLFGRDFLHLLYGAEYARESKILVWTMAAAGLGYVSSSFGFGATSAGRFKAQPWIVGLATLILLGSSLVLVPRFGLVGAAMAILISTFTTLCGYTTLVLWKTHDGL